MTNQPFTFDISAADALMNHYDSYYQRHLSQMAGYYLDSVAYAEQLAQADTVLYEVYSIDRPEESGELPCGISIIHPGKIGTEYVMTKGHFHAVLETGEVYYTLRGSGKLVMETPEGDWAVEELRPGSVTYVPPRWAHRTVNTGTDDLLFFWVFPGHAGHDYGTIETQGFRKLVVETDGQPQVVDNPRWRAEQGGHRGRGGQA